MSADEKVKVFVQVCEEVTLAKTLEMSRAEFDAIDRDLSADDGDTRRRAEERVRSMLDSLEDFQDADDLVVEEFGLEDDDE